MGTRTKQSSSDTRVEKRRFRRYHVDLPVTLKRLANEGYIETYGRCMDLSVGGLGIVCGADLGMGEVVTVTLALPGQSASLTARAIARNRRGLATGFEFIAIEAVDRQLIAKFCEGFSASAES